ncbi:Nn.00g109310.m01.CDS01 [Neocucurbitaria sp. VM-36]
MNFNKDLTYSFIRLAYIFIVSTSVSGEFIQDPQPHDINGWYSAPNYRSTLEVLWQCVFTIILCCWTTFHPDISHPNSTWILQYLDRTLALLVGVMFPEVFLYIAFYERLDARSSMKAMHDDGPEVPWSLTHAFYANMGGFRIEQTTHNVDERNEARPEYITAFPVYSLLRSQVDLETFPSRKEIKDKGKADVMAKALTIVQIVWILVQSVARIVQHLPLTTLEISTLAYIPCAIIAYILWWNKPYEVNMPTRLHLKPTGLPILHLNHRRGVAPHHEDTPCHCKHTRYLRTRKLLERHQIYRTQKYRTYETTRQCVEVLRSSLDPVGIFGFSSALIFLIVGAIHLAAWNFHFPSGFERWAWRICSILITTIIPLSWLITAVLLRVASDRWWDGTEDNIMLRKFQTMRWISMGIQGCALTVYGFARLYLLVEVFMGLRASPGGIYKTPEWTNFLPHFG